MGARSLLRKIDPDALARVLNRTPKPSPALKRVKPPRSADTYRAAKRNQVLRIDGGTWRGIKPTGRFYHGPVRPNQKKRDGQS